MGPKRNYKKIIAIRKEDIKKNLWTDPLKKEMVCGGSKQMN
jgi:hypothetical protein